LLRLIRFCADLQLTTVRTGTRCFPNASPTGEEENVI